MLLHPRSSPTAGSVHTDGPKSASRRVSFPRNMVICDRDAKSLLRRRRRSPLLCERRLRLVRARQSPAGPNRGERLVKRLEDSRFFDRRYDAVSYQIRVYIGVNTREHDADLPARQFREEVADSPGGGIVDVEDRRAIDDKPPDRRGRALDERAHLVGEAVGVGVEQVRAKTVDDEAGIGLYSLLGR